METKRIKLYFLLLVLLCLFSVFFSNLFYYFLSEDYLPISVMVVFTIPAFSSVLSLLSTNGFRNFRLDVIGFVGSGIWVIAFVILTFLLYFIVGDALRYPEYSRDSTAIILAACSFVGIIPMIALHDTFRKNAKLTKEQGQRPGKIWRNMQYATWAAAFILVLLPFLPGEKEDGYIFMFIEYGEYSGGNTSIMLLYLLLSISLTLIMLLAGWLWKQAKIASILSIILFIPVVSFGTYFYLRVTFNDFSGIQLARERSMVYQPESNTEVVYVYDEERAGDNEEYDEEDEEDEADDSSYTPEFIGDGIIGTSMSADQDWGDTDSIYSAVRYFTFYMGVTGANIPYSLPSGLLPYLERSPGNKYIKGYGGDAYDGLIKLLWNNRKSMVIDGVFDIYSSIVKKAMPYEKYRDSGYEKLVGQMIYVYKDLEKNPSSFLEIYNLMDEHTYEETNSVLDFYAAYYELLKPYVSDEAYNMIFPDYDEDKDDNENNREIEDAKCKAVWIYSFWGRRAQEKNHETVYQAMCKLDALYR